MVKRFMTICAVVSVFLAGMWVHAQTSQPAIEQHVTVISPPTTVIAGPDLGFRVEGQRGTIPIGRLVVRVDGQWVEVEDAVNFKRLTNR